LRVEGLKTGKRAEAVLEGAEHGFEDGGGGHFRILILDFRF
jgi:hypothetical protein